MACNVCHRDRSTVVCCSAFGPMSLAYCSECHAKLAEPAWTFDYLYDDVSEQGEGLAPHVSQAFTWRDGAYLSWPEYVAERRATQS